MPSYRQMKAMLDVLFLVIFFVDVTGAEQPVNLFSLGLPSQNENQGSYVSTSDFSSIIQSSQPFNPVLHQSIWQDGLVGDSYAFSAVENDPFIQNPAEQVYLPAASDMPVIQGTTGYVSNEQVGASAKQASGRKKRLSRKSKKKKKSKIMFKYANTAIAGGHRLRKSFRSLKGCMSACNKRPSCLSADYNKKTGFCYTHHTTACNNRTPQHGTTHFSKIPCEPDLDDTASLRSHLYIGLHRDNGRLDKSVKSFGDCMKKCLRMGNGVAPRRQDIRSHPQICIGIDYDFSRHKCYYHTLLHFAVDGGTQHACRGDLHVPGAVNFYPTADLSPLAHNVHLLLCPPSG